jgi:SAM-dependent methyltransferase
VHSFGADDYMAINTLQVAWFSRLAKKGILVPGQSVIEFSPQDILSSRQAVRQYGLRHNPPDVVERLLEGIFDGESVRPTGIPEFYRMFGATRYRSMDLIDARADWRLDFNEVVRLPEQFTVATNFGTAEHVFNIGNVFHSIHDALRPGGVALHVLPAFGDVDHGFYNIHPTIYFDLAAANDYTIEDICYGDRWDIRNKALEADLNADFDFDSLPIRIEHMTKRPVLQRMVTERFVENYAHPDTKRFSGGFPGILYDYCIVALRKNHDRDFQSPAQGHYSDDAAAAKAAMQPPARRGSSNVASGLAQRAGRVAKATARAIFRG